MPPALPSPLPAAGRRGMAMGTVATTLSKLLSVPLTEIATIGDMPNDVLMFRRSGLSIAMGNASPEVQKQARFVTASYKDEGFAKAVERYVLGTDATSPARKVGS